MTDFEAVANRTDGRRVPVLLSVLKRRVGRREAVGVFWIVSLWGEQSMVRVRMRGDGQVTSSMPMLCGDTHM
eukprot:CAMPEP_0184676110 /NCGR_PEP_ID=MMETSP0308-20130426/88177_1 /TAXON_ID=38269 /ORGANISM="Gloeochaete witrockiana, Strain SAG 46.84" /LENGTH=71 /DNA_ID=CAMNT_0027123919 /DNA_START=1419 /DNA_END=1634 /DNA_ORIENTATION=+